MTSKEALKEIDDILYINAVRSQVQDKILSMLEIIKQDLDRLEKLEKGNQELLVNKNVAQGIAKKFKEENDKLKKVIDKACERLEWTCPFEQKLMFETDCDLNCKDTYKECWKKYFMKEVLENENNKNRLVR